MIKHVSVIIPVFNDPKGIRKALGALTNQSYDSRFFEIFVVDNGSTDETLSVVKQFICQFPDLIQIVNENKKQGSYAARNAGIKIVKGNLIAFTDSDCIPEFNWLERGVEAFKIQKHSVAAGHIEMFFSHSKPNVWEYYDASHNLNQESYVKNYGFGTTANLFVLKKLFDRYGLFLDNLKSGGDYEFCRRMVKGGEQIDYLNDAVVRHPARSTLRSILKKNKRVAKGQKELKRLNLLDHNQINRRNFIPSKTVPHLKNKSTSLQFQILLIVTKNILKYHNLINRI
ncbi:glycosyltransferase [Thermodesulfobacteriota bacterium]